MSIDLVHKALDWPSPDEVWTPSNPSARVYADLAKRKIEAALRRLTRRDDIRVGILAPNLDDNSSPQPFAVVCEFQSAATTATLQEAHRLAWNFSRSPLLITIEPHIVRAWTCCEPPSSESSLHALAAEITDAQLHLNHPALVAHQAVQSLHWLELATGNFFRRHESRFDRNGCADRLLLENLRHVRQLLLSRGLSDDTSHDLLARLIFIQFLFDRKDSSGTAALNATKLRSLHKAGILKQPHDTLSSILEDYDDTYRLFSWLDGIFHGDLFPTTHPSRRHKAKWAKEMEEVKPEHLEIIADFVSGRVAMKSTQGLLWKEYSFDAIPLEFISCIYEEFVTKVGNKRKKTGAVYTPPHVVDFVLDEALPWDSTDWDIKVLDPACGSGIFLVKAFQRLVRRWRLAHSNAEPKPADLRHLLERNLFGTDIDQHAIRVASFSLYLAMCDEIDPKHYWTRVRFPRLRNRRLICSDFFSENAPGIRTKKDADTFDVVVGNAPWGQHTVGDSDISGWREAGWPAAYNCIGPIFLAKATALLKAGGRLSMLQPAGLILNTAGPAKAFRRKLLQTVAVEGITNLAPLRFILFPNAVGPACIVTFKNEQPTNDELIYSCPKPVNLVDDEYRILIEPHDVHRVRRQEALENPACWTSLMWGGPRDVSLINRLSSATTFRTIPGLRSREGIIRGNKRKSTESLVGRRILESPEFPEHVSLRLNTSRLPINRDPRTDSGASTDFSAFTLPQLLIKQSWTVSKARFEAALVDASAKTGGALCSQSFISIHVPAGSKPLLNSACLACNSSLAVYFHLLTSSRFASYRPEPLVNDWLNLPIPSPVEDLPDEIEDQTEIDRHVFDGLELTATDRVLIEDAVQITLADFKSSGLSPGREPTRSQASDYDPVLTRYCEQFIAVLRAAFGDDKRVRATIFQERCDHELPVRIVAFHLNWPGAHEVVAEKIDGGEFYDRLGCVSSRLAAGLSQGRFQRIARTYDSMVLDDRIIPSIYLVKPDRVRYWTRATAIRDADEVCADFLLSLHGH